MQNCGKICDLCKLKAYLYNNQVRRKVDLYSVKIYSQTKFSIMENSNKSANGDFKMSGNWE